MMQIIKADEKYFRKRNISVKFSIKISVLKAFLEEFIDLY